MNENDDDEQKYIFFHSHCVLMNQLGCLNHQRPVIPNNISLSLFLTLPNNLYYRYILVFMMNCRIFYTIIISVIEYF